MVTSIRSLLSGASTLALKESSTGLPSAIARAARRLRPGAGRAEEATGLATMTLLSRFPRAVALGVLQIAPIVLAAIMPFTSSSEVMCGARPDVGVGRI